jgi:hypothetical protein
MMSDTVDSIVMLTGAEYRKMKAESAASNHFAVKYLAHIDEQNVEVARLTSEVERLRSVTVVQETLIRKSEAENEKLKAGLRECEAELNAYYRMEYPGSHRYSQQELAQAMASNPATVTLKGVSND